MTVITGSHKVTFDSAGKVFLFDHIEFDQKVVLPASSIVDLVVYGTILEITTIQMVSDNLVSQNRIWKFDLQDQEKTKRAYAHIVAILATM